MKNELRFRFNQARLFLLRWWFRRQLKGVIKEEAKLLEALQPYMGREAIQFLAVTFSMPIAFLLGIYILLMTCEPKRVK